MSFPDGDAVVTGGAGFLGSHLVERLLDDGADVTVVDDLRGGNREWVPDAAALQEFDLAAPGAVDDLVAVLPTGADVYHLAADKYVDNDEPIEQYARNTRMTQHVVAAAEAADAERFVFTSSSTVYGEAPRPTPEDYAPLEPISAYGAGKLADEGLLSARAHAGAFDAWTFRFANVVGPRLRGAVVPDFIEKLQADPSTLEILGDGRQEKSYLTVGDCLDGMAHAVARANDPVNTFNLGTRTTTSVDRIAAIVAEELGVDPAYSYTGGERGWKGDVPKMCLSVEKLSALGWEPTRSSDDAIRRATRQLIEEL
ncbi:NAD-dependent epimerase/dehydratase family protein [Salinarchaeum sp. Harcht-Bsk1]|uniref:NAD-dependent epimerase/dehydratase family protein n=1 Tax=Salinarchaeum sp. Harcht-Bsk1 TaxID=1333523 RepID=UPI00067790E9